MDVLTLLTLLRPGTVVRVYSTARRRLGVWAHAECVMANEATHLKHCLQLGHKVRVMQSRLPYTEKCVLCAKHSPEPALANDFYRALKSWPTVSTKL